MNIRKEESHISRTRTGGAPSAIWKSNRRTSMESATTFCKLKGKYLACLDMFSRNSCKRTIF